jgi:hypothetical protein
VTDVISDANLVLYALNLFEYEKRVLTFEETDEIGIGDVAEIPHFH